MANRYWVGGTATWDATAGTKWATTSGGAGGSTVPTSADDVFFDANSGTGTVTISTTASVSCNALNFTGFTGTIALNTTWAVIFYGNLTLSSGMTITNGNGNWTYDATSGTATLTSNGKTLTGNLTCSGIGGTLSLADALTVSNTLTISYSSFLSNGYSITCGSILNSNSWTRTINFSSSTITVTGVGLSSNAVNFSGTSVTYTATGTISLTSASARNFVGGGYSLPSLTVNQGGAGALTFTGSSTYYDITNSYSATGATTIKFTSGTTTTLTQFTATGASGKVLTLGASTTSQATLKKSSTWYMGANSTDGGNNTGLTFTAGGGIDYLSVSYINGTTTAATSNSNFLMFF